MPMGGDVDRGFVHARIYGQYGKLLKRKDYEILANRQTPGEGTAGFVFRSPEEITRLTREKIFRHEVDRLFSVIQLNREYRRIAVALLGIFEVENLRIAAARCSRGFKDDSPWYDTEPWNHFSRSDIEEADTPEKLHRIIIESKWKDAWPPDAPEGFPLWELALEFLQLEIIRKDWGKNVPFAAQNAGRDLSVLFGISLSMKKIIRQFLSGTWEADSFLIFPEQEKPKGKKYYQLIREWSIELLKTLQPEENRDFYFDDEGIVKAETSLHRYAWTSARRKIFSNFHSPVTAASYLLLWYYQVKNLFAIAEGIRLGRKASKIMDLIICGE